MTFALATVTTWFDILCSTIGPEQLIAAAEHYRLQAVGIVDYATTLAHARLAQAARDTDIHVVYGATLVITGGFRLRILARTDDGYRNLCRLVSMQAQGCEQIAYDVLRAHREGLYLLCGGRHGSVWHTVTTGDERGLWQLAQLQALAERDDRFVIECQQYVDDTPADQAAFERLLDLAHRAGVRCIATHDVRVVQPDAGRTLRLLSAIQHRTTFHSTDPRLPLWRKGVPSPYTFPDPVTWYRRWEGLEHLVQGSATVLQDCQVELLGRKRFPGASLPRTNVFDALWSRAFAGLKQHYAQITPPLIAQLTHEIDEVTAQEVGPFLLYAAELVERAAARGIKMVLQGSGTGSLLCFALGISPVDPLTTQALVFERFCGRHRGLGDLPDLDFGVPAGREDEVKDLLIEMFGPARVAHLAAVATLQGRSAIRAAAQAFGWDNEQIALLHRKQKHGIDLDRYGQMILRAAQAIDGQPHHLLRHASGIVVADEPLVDLVGVAHTPDGPMVLADKDDAEALQVLKFDILPWYLLAIYDQAEATIQAQVYPKPELWQVPGEDPLTGDLLEQADTRAIPYLQSPACMTLLRALRVRTEADLALCLGALRPGASTTRERLMAAIHGGSAALPAWEVLTAEHQQAISTILAPSRGAFIFDEDFLRVVNQLGVSFADAERLRKVYKRSSDDAIPQLNRLRAAALATGWSDAEIDVVFGWLQFIRRYTFTRGHAVAMAHTAWRVARIAARYPCHFFAAVFDQLGQGIGGGMYPVLVYITEARRKGLAIEGPSVNSTWQSTPQDSTIRCGLTLLRAALSSETLQRIVEEARARPFTSVVDFCGRVDLSKRELEQLIAAGALDDLASSRRKARWEAQLFSPAPQHQPRLLERPDYVPLPDVEPERWSERAAEEYASLGFTLSTSHPLDLYQEVLAGEELIPSDHLPTVVGQQVTIAGVIVASRRISTEAGRPMAFISLCDAYGIAELTLFDTAYVRAAQILEHSCMVIATGIVTADKERGVGLEVDTLRPIA
jgi:DNA polymerase III alpha subunit